MDTLLQQSDHLLITLPYSNAVHHAIGAAHLALMKPSATLINIARGGIDDVCRDRLKLSTHVPMP